MISHGLTNLLRPYETPYNPLIYSTATAGVEIFFALSGFLIGRILLDIEEAGADRSLIGRFLVRRWMRTLPLYYFYLGLVILVWPSALATLPTFLVMAQNLFAPIPTPNYFPQSWSLPIEELCYLLLPVIILLSRRARQPVLTAVCVLIVTATAIRYFWESGDSFSDVRLIAIGRIDAIAYGLIAAIVGRRLEKFYWRHAKFLVLLAIAVAVPSLLLFAYPDRLNNVYGRYLALSLFDMAVAICLPALCRDHLGSRVVDRAVRLTSNLAYALYIVHVAVAAGVHVVLEGHSFAWRVLAYAFMSYAAAATLSVLIERPIMRLRPKQFVTLPVKT